MYAVKIWINLETATRIRTLEKINSNFFWLIKGINSITYTK